MGYVGNEPPRLDRVPWWEGRRGEGWVVLQGVVLLVWLVAPPLGPAWPGPLRVAAACLGGLMAAGGAALAFLGARELGPLLTPFPRPTDRGRLIDTGPFRLVRHPIYSGLVLLLAGLALVTANVPRLGVAGLLLCFFWAKSTREERWLSARLPDYAAYQRRVGRLWPRWP